MTFTPENASQRAAYWPVPIARAVPAAACALVICFSADHSARFGLLTFGFFATVAGIVLGIMVLTRLRTTPVRSFLLAQSVVTIIAGILSLAANTGGVRYLFLILTFFAAITGLLELYSGIRSRGRFVASGDWLSTGIFTLAMAVIFLVIPPGYSHTYHDPDGVIRVLDSAVIVVGLLGAYTAILTVYLLISGFSAKWGPQVASPDSSRDADIIPPAQLSEKENNA